MECLLPYSSMVTVPHIMVRLERMLDYRGVGLARFHCTAEVLIHIHTYVRTYVCMFVCLRSLHVHTYMHTYIQELVRYLTCIRRDIVLN